VNEDFPIADGGAIIFGRIADTWAVGVLRTIDGKAVAHPMGEHLERELLVEVERNDAIDLSLLQPPLPPLEQREPIEPVVVMQKGTVIAERSLEDPRRYRLFEVAEDVIHSFDQTDFSQPWRVKRFEPGKGAVSAPFDLPGERRSLPVQALAGLARLQFAAVPDRFLGVLRIPVITEWSTDDVSAAGSFPTKALSGRASLAFRDGRASATLAFSEHLLFQNEPGPVEVSSIYAKLCDGTLTPEDTSAPRWVASRIVSTGMSSDAGGSVFSFAVPQLLLTFAEGSATATRETFRGLTLKAFSHRVVPENPSGWHTVTAPNAYAVTAFGREVRIVQSASNHVSVLHDGPPLCDDEVGRVLSLVQYFCGNRGEHVSTETFGAAGRLTFAFHERASATSQGVAPVRIDHWTPTPTLIERDFEPMLARMRALQAKSSQKLDAAFHHYFEGVASSYPVTRILMLAVAIDTLVALEIGNQRQANILDLEIFNRLLPSIREAIDEALARENVVGADAQKIRNKLAGLNNAGAAQRQRDFWASLAIDLTEEEDEVLKRRHEVVHEGHVGSERTAESLWGNYRRSAVLANLFNRAMLKLLGWTGPYLDATDFKRHRELQLVDGTPPPDQVPE
jgi:hypothetical protein